MPRLVTIIAVLLCCSIAIGKPTRPEPPKPKAADVLPDLSGPSNWGYCTQAGTSIQINGHSSWYAIGLVRPDGKVQLTWTLTDGSRSGIGVYTIKNGCDLEGRWGWCESVEVDKNGDLQGETMGDTTYKIKLEPPEIQ